MPILLSACASAPPAPAHLTLLQRTSQKIPNLGLVLTIGDVTLGQVLTKIDDDAGEPVVLLRSMQPGDVATFRRSGSEFTLGLVKLRNRLFGDDLAEFELGPADRVTSTQIESMLERLAESRLTFVRNGEEFSGERAAAHLRAKLAVANPPVRTANEFLERIATRSASTGRPYTVKIGSDTSTPLARWLRWSSTQR
ncbi:MAG: DUF5329 family protein [Planctomycetes bacterium]|nr:DUF5329 family protein [Planctomycetota bacterium]